MAKDINLEEATAVKGEYNAEQIHVLEGLEAVRKRPAMYIGSTSERGLHHLVYEVIDNSIDEALAGYCSLIDVTIHEDNSITVADNGRGIPVDMMKKEKKPAVEVIMTVLHAGGKFGDGGYKVSGGLHGVGVTCVNALSEHMEVEVRRGGKKYGIEFKKGKTVKKLYEIGEVNETGTTVHFKPDATIFTETVYNYETLRHRIRELAFLNKGITVALHDLRPEGKSETFHFAGGIIEFVNFVDEKKDKINEKVIYLEGNKNGVIVEVAMQYCDTYNENVFTYVNNINTEEGGTHLSGFKKALTRTINNYARKANLLKENEDAFLSLANRENLTATPVAVVTEEPRLVMEWNGKTIVDISREFLNSNGADKHISIVAENPTDIKKSVDDSFTENMHKTATDLNTCSKRGLSERFDSTIGAGTVLMPFGGKNQLTPIQAMVQKISVEKKHTDNCSLMAFGYNPFITEQSPYHGAYLAVVESVCKLIATGADFKDVYLTFQEYFKHPGKDGKRWGKPLAALLGAFEAQMQLGIGAIGGKDSMSGSFEKMDVPPTLISFAVTTENIDNIVSPEFKAAGNPVYVFAGETAEEKKAAKLAAEEEKKAAREARKDEKEGEK